MKIFSLCNLAAIALCSGVQAATVDLGVSGNGFPFRTEQPAVALTPLVQVAGNRAHIGSVRFFAGNYAPGGYEIADGRLRPISANEPLFSKIGTTYGGDGQYSYALPNLVGRTVIGTGGAYSLGQTVGASVVQLTEDNLPIHSHSTPDGDTSAVGLGTPYSNQMSSLALDLEIAEFGVYPSRNGPVGNTPPLQSIGFVSIDAAQDTGLASGGMLADGRAVPTQSSQALFSILGTTYGGDGATSFALPDTRDRIITGAGAAPGLTERNLGETQGTSTETLLQSQLPTHAHMLPDGTQSGQAGLGLGQNNLQEELALNWIIASDGLFPYYDGSPNEAYALLGEMALFAGNFTPSGWLKAEGQMLQIADNSALYSVLGTAFGGDGTTTFALPDMRGRVAVGAGGVYQIGTTLGTESIFLSENNLPPHTHRLENAAPSAVPLPAGLWMFLGALAGFGLFRKRGPKPIY